MVVVRISVMIVAVLMYTSLMVVVRVGVTVIITAPEGTSLAMVVAFIVEKNIGVPAWLAVEPSKSLHQSYQQFDIIVDLASDGRRGGVYEGIEAVKFAELVKSTEVVKFLETGELPDAIKLVEADELVGFVRLGKKEVLTLEG